MYIGKTLFAQIMDFLPWKTFHRIVNRYDGDFRIRTLSCAEHFRILAFAQLTYRESLRDIETCLQERQHFSRKLKWDPSDFSSEKFAGGYCLRRPAFVLLRPRRTTSLRYAARH